ncbi:MAG: DUF1015 domain-containing protein [Clostridia bacterium]|nr:DUF1015 domain-containing protein [Clostridia bacterium]
MYLYPSDILLPDFRITDGTKWSTVACDQYTSEPEYWEAAGALRAGSKTTLDLMLPEAFLSSSEEKVPKIHAEMKSYLDEGVLISHPSCGVYVKRVQSDGRTRRGLVACIDLEDYDYAAGSVSPVRATEKTVAERIPPRLAVRRGAPIEMPHIMLLIDDPSGAVLGPLEALPENAYSYSLSENGGSISGSFVPASEFDRINKELNKLAEGKKNPIVLAVGDGNHSLATAKASYEEIKAEIGAKAAETHPARYALCETVNIYDSALDFEPIYRLVSFKNADDEKALIEKFGMYLKNAEGSGGKQEFSVLCGDTVATLVTENAPFALPVTTLQRFLDAELNSGADFDIDYIHGEASLKKLASKSLKIGFAFEGMKKSELFPSVESDGCLPRKTFSMGHADDKRYYTECRKIL